MFAVIVLVLSSGFVVAMPPQTRSIEEIERFRSFLESTRKYNEISIKPTTNPLAKVWQNSGRYEGDILLDDDQVDYMVKQYANRNAYIWPNTVWPRNTIPYEISSEFGPWQRYGILAAMQEIEANTCIRFRRRNREDRNFVWVTGRPDGCYAHVGYWESRGVHTLNLANNYPGEGCLLNTIIIHEWLHIIGFWHMQSTHSRDDHVRVLWENIWPGMEFNFDKYAPDVVDNLDLPYEYDSNMHYDRYGFSANGEPTLLPLDDDHGLMGQMDYVTPFDWLRVNRHYNCPGAWSEPINTSKTA